MATAMQEAIHIRYPHTLLESTYEFREMSICDRTRLVSCCGNWNYGYVDLGVDVGIRVIPEGTRPVPHAVLCLLSSEQSLCNKGITPKVLNCMCHEPVPWDKDARRKYMACSMGDGVGEA